MRIPYNAKIIASTVLCICLVFANLLNFSPVSAMVITFFEGRPASVSNDTTPTFTFSTYDSDTDDSYAGGMECRIDSGSFSPCTSPFTAPSLTPGDHTFVVHAVSQSDSNSTATYTWTTNQLPVFSGGTSVSGVAGVPMPVTDLQIDDADNDVFQVNLTVPSGTLRLGTTTGITFSGSSTGTSITFTGTRTSLNNALATLVYTPDNSGSVNIEATLSGAAGSNINTFNGHFYEVINSNTSWATAKSLAEATSYGGTTGYLANVTSAAEEDYLQARMSDGVWISGSDAATEGDWIWTSGPEANTAFWASGMAVNGAYTLWQAAQPDNNGNEDCLELRLNGSESWNDENCGNGRHYVIEYGTNSLLPILDSIQVSTTALTADGDLDGDGVSNSVEANAPNGGDANNDNIADYTQANVTSKYNSLSKGYVVLQTSCTTNEQVQISEESSTQKDIAYDYPYGLASFTGTNCGSPGDSATITKYYYDLDKEPGELSLRKWNSDTGAYSTIDNATLSLETIGNKQAVKVIYEVIDGGVLDQDGIADGNITDPAGLAIVNLGAPNTGLGGPKQSISPFIYAFIGLGFVAIGGIYVFRRPID